MNVIFVLNTCLTLFKICKINYKVFMKLTIDKFINYKGFDLIFTIVKIIFNAWLIIDLFAMIFWSFNVMKNF